MQRSFILCTLIIYTTACLLASPPIAEERVIITSYEATFIHGFDESGTPHIAIRVYARNNIPYFLLVNPYTLTTQTAPVASFTVSGVRQVLHPTFKTIDDLKKTPYFTALHRYSSPPYSLQNYGLKHAENPVNGMFLTIDMCPSSQPMDRIFFEKLVALSQKHNKPIPIAIAISGLWALTHQESFAWLLTQQHQTLDITWVNHTFSHPYYPQLALQHNYMLSRPDDITQEILRTEVILLENNQLPSVFFRFPGLVADQKLITQVAHLGLIPIGTDAWLALPQKPHPGCIVLVHGNSDEPEGIQAILPLLDKDTITWLPLNKAIITS